MITGTKLIHVPYKGGGPALQDVLSGQVPVIFVDLFTLLPHVKSGKLKVLAVTGSSRAAIAPDIPTALEQGIKGFEIMAWLGLFAPTGTPDDIVLSLQSMVAKACKHEPFVKKMAESGAELVASTPTEFKNFFHQEIELYKRIAATAGIRLAF